MTLLTQLTNIVGTRHVLTKPAQTERFTHGYRFGQGKALAVVMPATLYEYWQVLQACVAADVVIISQASNTGLTGGSTPTDMDRDTVLINVMRIKGIQLINDASQVVCLPAATLNELEQLLAPHGREPHSVIGSSCIGASVIGGVCNNSGGALVQRGPAFTEMALFAQVDKLGKLQLINHLGIELGDTPETIFANLEQANYTAADITAGGLGHDIAYREHVRQIDDDLPARFNADKARHFEASGSAGKLAVFAVRLDTFAMQTGTKVFYIGTNDTQKLTKLRQDMLRDFAELPISGEYIHKDAFDMAAVYGKDTFVAIKRFGTQNLPKLFALKAKTDAITKKIPLFGANFSDRVMQFLSKFIHNHLPVRMLDFRQRFEHHLILKVSHDSIQATQEYLTSVFQDDNSDYFACDENEATAAMLHRFAVASAAVRYRAVHSDTVSDIAAIDVALRRNDKDWFEVLPDTLNQKILHKLYYGHFFCHVFHQDYIVKQGYDWQEVEHEILALLAQRGAKYPAEHNVGHLYMAEADLANFYQQLDPTNTFNAGIGKTSKEKHWHCGC
ncbi:MAG: D-lactate dehydrogenase [Moraxella sp.]|nr:D-lactate dehydrogenase [Moraxella sp.]